MEGGNKIAGIYPKTREKITMKKRRERTKIRTTGKKTGVKTRAPQKRMEGGNKNDWNRYEDKQEDNNEEEREDKDEKDWKEEKRKNDICGRG